MHISYTAHNPKGSLSSSSLIEYLDKENNEKEDLQKSESFFNGDYDSINSSKHLEPKDIINDFDNNRGSQKNSASNYFMMNISPSVPEIKHMEKIAVDELNKRGVFESKKEIENVFFNEQKDQLIKMQLKLYTQNVMVEYAKNFDREIFRDESKLPNDNEKKALNLETEKKFAEFLKSKNIEIPVKSESLPNESKKYVTVNNIKEIENKGKSLVVEIDLKELGKADVMIPSKAIHLQKDGSYKIPENLYESKTKEVLAKNTFKEIDYDLKEVKTISLNNTPTKVYHFEKENDSFSSKLSFSVNEKDIKFIDGKPLMSEHLLNEKKKYSIEKNIEKEFGKEKEAVFNKLATEKGFDLSKRPLTERDLLWTGKVETQRTYKHTDENVKHNKSVLLKIKEIQAKPNFDKNSVKLLEKELIKDKKGNVIKEGLSKGDNQYHVHVVVSRHDKTMKNPRNKISLSPLANAVDSKAPNGSKIGFNRKEFAQKIEKVFDAKFEYSRPKEKTFEAYNDKAQALNKGKSEAKQFLMKHTGLNSIKANISPVQSIKKEIGIANIPTSLPKNVTEAIYKVAKKILTKGIEY